MKAISLIEVKPLCHQAYSENKKGLGNLISLVDGAEVNISSYPARILAGLFFFCRAEILNSGGFVQKYSDQGVSCKNIGQ